MDSKKLLNLIKRGEGIKLDFKQMLELDIESGRKELSKDICAIANSRGGRGYLIIGIEDKTKKIIGVDEENYSEEKIQQIVSSRCEPPIPVSLEFVDLGDKKIAVINIYDGAQKPYQLRENGAFYIRRGSTTDTMRKEEIISALNESLSLNVELCPVVKSDVSFIDRSLVQKYFNLKSIEVNDNNIINLMENASIITFDKDSNKYLATLGGMLVFSKYNSIFLPHNMIKIINNVNKNFPNNIIITGDLLSMLDKSEECLREVLPKNYPIKGVYEGLTNSILYRDYTLCCNEIEIIINPNSIVLVSPGVIINGKDIETSKYLKRNMWIYEKLITIDNKNRFFNTGRGFLRMKKYFKGKGKVVFVNSIKENSFKIIYPGVRSIKQM
ncbi:putative DNA binding domain-containing protein [Clostridium sp. MSJ-11]|uniref:DNA binding domain-containing protein n=1 Tax=Clostridium mobile TaxID=2841512 RepID=A0ABS6EKT2_9CLOT|nr:RNA-binding domain-containing protein [Clostridium mobile]MBU5485291.1 putative DNA binding domain-containing protein [Clostridium mobile]